MVLLVALSALYGCGDREPTSTAAAETLPPLDFGGDFALTDHQGRSFALADLRGQVVLLFFGFTTCPDVCPLTMSKIAAAREALGADGKNVATVFVSVDVEHDTPPVLASYVGSFEVPLIGLTGTKAEIDRIIAQYHGSYQIVPAPTSALGYQVSHTAYTYLIDQQGRLRHLFRHADAPDAIASGVAQVLREGRS